MAAGDAALLRSAQFKPYGPGGQEPHQNPFYSAYGTTPDLLRLGLLDPSLRFFQEAAGDPQGSDPLRRGGAGMARRRKAEFPFSTLAVSLPSAADLAIGVVLNLLFEVALRGEFEGPGIGRPRPVFIVLEEAHRYLGSGASALTRDSANRIAREGRKYGVGLLLVTQRPTAGIARYRAGAVRRALIALEAVKLSGPRCNPRSSAGCAAADLRRYSAVSFAQEGNCQWRGCDPASAGPH